jgi:hypothetical protein
MNEPNEAHDNDHGEGSNQDLDEALDIVDQIRKTNTVLAHVCAERLRQDDLVKAGKFLWNCGTRGISYEKKLAVLGEEFGEVSREIVEWGITTDKYAADPVLLKMPPHREQHYRARIREELIQLAACCVAFAETLDES